MNRVRRKSPAEPTTTVTAQRPATTERPAAPNEPMERDNTGVNVRDRDSTARTPIDQNENKTDVQITADIRKRVVATKLSVDAHNVKIITQDGKVTLRGPVKTDDEKQQIEEIAVTVAGANNVDNQLEVKNN
jgi:hyperosmotically inducible protein